MMKTNLCLFLSILVLAACAGQSLKPQAKSSWVIDIKSDSPARVLVIRTVEGRPETLPESSTPCVICTFADEACSYEIKSVDGPSLHSTLYFVEGESVQEEGTAEGATISYSLPVRSK